jgi:hypothetical protein
MQPGPKPVGRSAKAARGTVQKCRDGVDTRERAAAPLVVETVALRPPEMSLAAADVWAEYVEHLVANGGRQCDAEAFAEWCTMVVLLRACRTSKGEDEEGREIDAPKPVPASYIAQWRLLSEMLGLVGAKSRLGGSAPIKPTSNPFDRNGRR